MRTLKRLILLTCAVSMLLAAWFYHHIHQNIHLPTVPYEFSIKSGSNLKKVAYQLTENGVLANPWPLIVLARIKSNAALIKAGDYTLRKSYTLIELLNYLIEGDIKQVEIKFVDGWTFSKIRKVLNDHPAIKHDTLNMSEQQLLRAIGANEKSAEGLFFPDTYFFVANDSDVAILQRAYQAMRNNLQKLWPTRVKSLPLKTPYDALILASIVEKETGLANDRGKIASVFINRLRIGMRLQTDPTIIYGLGEKFDGNLRRKDLRTDQPYNTYTRAGLPPTPIAMPGLAAIQATLMPEKTNFLYFVARGDGTSQFSSNLAAHNRAVAKYQKRRKK